jgi:1,4-dihydroxy-2-naphthoyl-CoA hydrolase
MDKGFTVRHTVRFHETDAAGVVYFSNGLTICHNAYEASLAAVGIDLSRFFSPGDLAYPIVRAKIDYQQPIRCGDELKIWLWPQQLEKSTFEVEYQIFNFREQVDRPLARALTRHVCIEPRTRQRHSLPREMENWLQRWGEVANK